MADHLRLLRDVKDCRTCEGTGIVTEDDCLVPCPDCDGIHDRVAEWNAGDFSLGGRVPQGESDG